MKYLLWTAILWPGIAVAAFGDEVLLTNGHKVVGIVRGEQDRVIVRMNIGNVEIPRSQVQRIVYGRTLLHDYDEREAALSTCPDTSSIFDLALWSRAHGLTRYVNDLLLRILAIDPDHEEARMILGFVHYKGRWMSALELKKALGWVVCGGHWVSPEERDAWCSPLANPDACDPPVLAKSRIRRVHAPPEGVPYTLGIPAGPIQETHKTGSGGFRIWGGVWPTHNLMDLPVIVHRTR